MKALIFTTRTQGQRRNDFLWGRPGEFVRFGLECDGERVDGKCGCRRSLAGFDTCKAGTTFEIVEIEKTREEFRQMLCEAMQKSGWISQKPTTHDNQWIDEMVEDLCAIADHFSTGSVIERRGDKYQKRLIGAGVRAAFAEKVAAARA